MAPHMGSHRAPCSCFPKKLSLQLSSEQSVGDVGITQVDWKRVPHAPAKVIIIIIIIKGIYIAQVRKGHKCAIVLSP